MAGGFASTGVVERPARALVAAFEAGYYNIPRDVTLEELADELGISHQALSERFRRAYEGLITAELDLE